MGHSVLAMNGADTTTWASRHFQVFEGGLNGESKSTFHALRKEAFKHFSAKGFPTKRLEEWRYTDLGDLAKFPLEFAKEDSSFGEDSLKQIFGNFLPLHRVVFVNGKLSPSLSTPWNKNASLWSLASVLTGGKAEPEAAQLLDRHLAQYADSANHPFIALNTAFAKDGAIIRLSRGASISEPLHLIFVTTSQEKQVVTYPRILIVAEENSEGSFVEHYCGFDSSRYLTTPVTEVVGGKNSRISHLKVQREGRGAYHVGTLQVQLSEGATFATNTFSFGGGVVRNEINPVLNGEHITCTFNGLTVLNGEQHVDNHTVLDHAKPNCQSTEVFKGIYSDRSKGVFNGTIIVRPDAQKTNAIQSNQTLLLSDEASIDSQPQLKIWADDVKCTHGATIGQLDEDALFYLRSRGIGVETARNILVHAFASDLISQVSGNPEIREYLAELLLAKLDSK